MLCLKGLGSLLLALALILLGVSTLVFTAYQIGKDAGRSAIKVECIKRGCLVVTYDGKTGEKIENWHGKP